MLKKLFSIFIFTCLSFISYGGEAGTFNNIKWQTCFTPPDQCTNLIVKTIEKAKQSIFVQAYSFTSAPIIKALADKHQEGVKLLILLDKSNVSSKYSVITYLKNHNIPYVIDSKPAIAHNKIMIIDTHIVITGSFNFTKAAQQKNAENILIIDDNALAKSYLKNFEFRKKLYVN